MKRFYLLTGIALLAAGIASSGLLERLKENWESDEEKEAAEHAADPKEDFVEFKDEFPAIHVSITNHTFEPNIVEIPAGKKVKLVIKNNDNEPEEFDSSKLNREKVIPAGQEGSVFVGPLEPGDYEFVGEMHEDTAKGLVRAK